MRTAIFEDAAYRQLLPMVYLRPVFHLRSGILLISEKIERRMPSRNSDWFVRSSLQALLLHKYPERTINTLHDEDYLFINARLLVNSSIHEALMTLATDTLVINGTSVIAARVSKKNISNINFSDEGLIDFTTLLNQISTIEWSSGLLFNYLWDLIARNPVQIENDFALSPGSGFNSGKIYEGVHLVEPQKIYIAEGAVIYPGAVLVAEKGPIYIEKDAKIFPQVFIEGPAFVGEKSIIKAGAKIYGGTSVGELCKVGGEVECSVLHSYSNKQHEGFLGHSYLGQWVNLGADTNNSDLKNNYGKVRAWANNGETDTGLQFVGLMMADHSKTGINTMFNTGTVTGIFCNIFGAGFPSKYIPDFSWGGAEGFQKYDAHKAIETAKTVMLRRNIEMSIEEEEYILHLSQSFNVLE